MKRVLFILLLCCGGYVSAQEVRDSVNIYFRQGHSVLDLLYQNNGNNLKGFASRLRVVKEDSLYRIRNIRIVGGASPEGSTTLNKQLSEKRAAHIVAFLKQQISLEGIPFNIDARGIDWQGLTELVEKSDMPYRDEVLHILYNTPEWITRGGVVVDGRKRQLGMLHGGLAWKYMYEHFFPTLRSSGVKLICDVERLAPSVIEPATETKRSTAVKDTVMIIRTDTIIRIDTVFVRDMVYIANCPRRPFYMAVKTNTLYDALAVPNLGVEFYLGHNWSIAADWAYGWWNNNHRHRYWRIYGGELELRYWFGTKAAEKPLQGHHVALYGQTVTYDFEFGGKGQMGGEPGGSLWDRASFGVGLAYGYSMPIARRLNLDFTLGLGYLGGRYYEYIPIDQCYVWQSTHQRRYWGPTKLEISLVWLIGRGNYNVKKGGDEQ